MFKILEKIRGKINQSRSIVVKHPKPIIIKPPINFKNETFYEEDIDEKKLEFIINHFEKRIHQAIIAKNTSGEQFGNGRLISPDWIVIKKDAIRPMLGKNGDIVICCLTKANNDDNPIWEDVIYFDGKKEMLLKSFLKKKIKTNQDVQDFEMALIKML